MLLPKAPVHAKIVIDDRDGTALPHNISTPASMIGQTTLVTLSTRSNYRATREPYMTVTPEYIPPDVWVWEKNDSPHWRYSDTN